MNNFSLLIFMMVMALALRGLAGTVVINEVFDGLDGSKIGSTGGWTIQGGVAAPTDEGVNAGTWINLADYKARGADLSNGYVFSYDWMSEQTEPVARWGQFILLLTTDGDRGVGGAAKPIKIEAAAIPAVGEPCLLVSYNNQPLYGKGISTRHFATGVWYSFKLTYVPDSGWNLVVSNRSSGEEIVNTGWLKGSESQQPYASMVNLSSAKGGSMRYDNLKLEITSVSESEQVIQASVEIFG